MVLKNVDRKKSKDLGLKLITIQGLVKRQRTKELQSDLFAFAERCLLDLNMEFLKKEGLTKLRNDDNYIPFQYILSLNSLYGYN